MVTRLRLGLTLGLGTWLGLGLGYWLGLGHVIILGERNNMSHETDIIRLSLLTCYTLLTLLLTR